MQLNISSKTAGFAATALLALACIPFAINAFFAHPQCDEFSFAAWPLRIGFFEAQARWYNEWTGRYAATFVLSLISAVPGMIEGYWLICISGMAVFIASLRYLAGALVAPPWRWPLALASALLGFCGLATPAESLYWAPAIVTYMLSAALIATLAGLLLRPGAGARKSVVAGLIAALVAGLNELGPLLLCAFLACGILHFLAQRRRPPWPWLVALACVVIGGLVAAIAPGNAARSATEALERPQEFYGIDLLLYGTEGVVQQALPWMASPGALALGGLAFMAGTQCAPAPRRALWLLLIVPAAVILAGVAANLGGSRHPAGRVMDFLLLVLIPGWCCALGVAGAALKPALSHRALWLSVIAAVCAFAAGVADGRALRLVTRDLLDGDSVAFDDALGARWQSVRDSAAQGQADVFVPPPPKTRSLYVMDVPQDRPDPARRYAFDYGTYFGCRAVFLE